MKKLLKAVLFMVFSMVMLRACHLEYVYEVADSIPEEVRERIISEHPECADMEELAAFWEANKDSLTNSKQSDNEIQGN